MSLSPVQLSYLKGVPGYMDPIDFTGKRTLGWVIPIFESAGDESYPIRFDIELTFRDSDSEHRRIFNRLRSRDGPVDVTLVLRGVEQEVTLPVEVPAETMNNSVQFEEKPSQLAGDSQGLIERLEVVNPKARIVLADLLAD